MTNDDPSPSMKPPGQDSFSYGNSPVFPVSLEACSEGCAGFKRLTQDGWSDYGLCMNPRSPRHGSPVRLGRDCAYALTSRGPRPA